MMKRSLITLAGLGAAGALAACGAAEETTATVTADAGDLPRVVAASDVEAGRYLVKIGGCKNLRLTTQRLTEDEWVRLMDEGKSLPPMPWPSVRAMSEADRRAIYRYIRQLPGDPGQPSPEPLPPGATPPAAG